MFVCLTVISEWSSLWEFYSYFNFQNSRKGTLSLLPDKYPIFLLPLVLRHSDKPELELVLIWDLVWSHISLNTIFCGVYSDFILFFKYLLFWSWRNPLQIGPQNVFVRYGTLKLSAVSKHNSIGINCRQFSMTNRLPRKWIIHKRQRRTQIAYLCGTEWSPRSVRTNLWHARPKWQA